MAAKKQFCLSSILPLAILPLATLPLAILPALHLLLCFCVLQQHFEGSWGGFFIFLADYPFSILILLIADQLKLGIVALVVLGTLWWYFLGWIAIFLLRKISDFMHKVHAKQ